MTMKSKMNILLIIMLLSLSLAACSSDSNNRNNALAVNDAENAAATNDASEAGNNTNVKTTADSEDKAGGEPVEITYWHMWTNDYKAVVESFAEEFNRTHPHIKVKTLSIAGDGDTKFLTAQAGGNPPDVMTQWNSVIASWAEKGVIMSLEDYIKRDAPDLKQWLYPTVAKKGIFKDKMYAVPFSMGDLMLFYNKDIFREAGLDPEKPPTTIEELDVMQDKLWKYDNRGFIERVGFLPGWYTAWNTAFGGRWLDENGNPTANDPNNVKALEWFESYAKKYDPKKIASFQKSVESGVIAADPFYTGKAAFSMDGIWKIVDAKKYAPDMDFGVVPLPYPEGGKPNATYVWGNYNIIPTNSKHPEEAWEFVKWMSGYGNEQLFAKKFAEIGGWNTVSPKITEQDVFQKFMDEVPARRQLMDLMESENAQIFPNMPDQAYYQDRISVAEQSVMTGQATAKEALDKVQKEIEKEITKNKE